MPQMLDPNFNGTLTYVCEHNEQGAMGVIINRRIQLSMRELFEQVELPFSGEDRGVFAGGPVQQDRGFVLHNDERKWESSLDISDSLKLTTSKDILSAISNNEGPNDYLITLGYAGWGEGQLEEELTKNTWLSCPFSSDVISEIIFCPDSEHKLSMAMDKLGIDTTQLNGQIGHA